MAFVNHTSDVRVARGAQVGDLLMRRVGDSAEYYRVVGQEALVKVRAAHARAEMYEAEFLQRLGYLCWMAALKKTKETNEPSDKIK